MIGFHSRSEILLPGANKMIGARRRSPFQEQHFVDK